jgi:hypothetical protein
VPASDLNDQQKLLRYFLRCLRLYSQAIQGRNQTVSSRMLTYAHVCSRMLTYAHVCSRMLACLRVQALVLLLVC